MADQTKSVIIGLFVLAAFSIIIFMMLFLHPNVGNEGKIIRVRFADIDKITVGTRVTYAGKPVGEVVDIREIEGHRLGEEDGRVDYNGIIYVYELTLAIDSGVDVFTTDDVTSRTSGLLGEKSVSIMPLPPLKGKELIPVTDQVIFATETGSVESTLKEFKELSDKIEVTLDGFIEAFGKLHDEKVWENVGNIAQNLKEITDAVNKPESLRSTVEDLSVAMGSARDILEGIHEGRGTLGKLVRSDDLYNDLRHIAAAIMNSEGSLGKLIYNDDIHKDLAFITNTIQSGQGSLGKILINDDFYLRLASLMSKAEVVLNDVNHYGLLFHLDKGWKRLRARRMNLMQQLCSAQQFRNYFNDELDSITTSLERVSLVLQKSDEVCDGGLLFQNPEYLKVYSELLRRVSTLEESLEMYNQQVVDMDVKKVEFLDCQ